MIVQSSFDGAAATMNTAAWRLFPILWFLGFIALIVVNAGVGSVLFLPVGLLIIPYFLLSRTVRAEPSRPMPSVRIGLSVTVGIMLAAVVWMTLLTFGIGAPLR
jgi:hypothetical protein